MKTTGWILFFLLFFLDGHGQHVTLTIQVTGIEQATGYLELGIYHEKEAKHFAKEGYELSHVYVPVTRDTVILSFDLPAGNYAVSAYHDENANHKCDRNMVGIPKEKIAFSQDVKPRLSVPSFEKTKFSIRKDTTVMIRLIHLF